MRRLLLLRHGKADRHSAGGDRERPLTRRGEEDARRIGEFLHDEGMTPDLAVASNARRAKQTLERALEAFPAHVTHLIENTIYLATVDHLVEVLRQTPDKVKTLLAVGHNPGFAELAYYLAGSGEPADIDLMRSKYPTAALAILDFETDHWSEVRRGAARLHRFVTPARLRGDEDDDPD
ncbi:histidine phosphatase family protein [Methylocystis sp. WRRC1]|uniref:SixA phosphatase family protein n=1 Tax=Methylocystis sp. WRRC1 TaxID=1732014 RepID=UPI001D146B00|nr:histidine phosphatase family protein [Methylocystis sp. WRRC1]MCC3246980.1 histidine phosphatase family protein [Methylocystis sp. WRRC1]